MGRRRSEEGARRRSSAGEGDAGAAGSGELLGRARMRAARGAVVERAVHSDPQTATAATGPARAGSGPRGPRGERAQGGQVAGAGWSGAVVEMMWRDSIGQSEVAAARRGFLSGGAR